MEVSEKRISDLETLDEIREFIGEGYALGRRGIPLPLAVSVPGPLVERAVTVAGPEGITLQDLRSVFDQLGADRLDEGVKFARSAGIIRVAREKRTNRAGRLQQQVVLYPPDR